MSDPADADAARPARGRARKRKAPRNCEWRDDVLHGRVRIKGRLHRWTLRTGDVEVARERVRADIEALKAKLFYDGTRIRYEELAASWAETHIMHEVSARSARRYAVSLKQLEPWLIDLFVDEIDKAKCKEIVAGRRAQGVTTATIKRDLVALGSVLKFGDVDDNPALLVMKSLKERRDPIVLPDPEHVRRVFARCPPGRLAAIAEACWLTGCRQEEMVTAERNKLDHARRQLTVRGKRNKVRTIELAPAAYELLRSQPVMLGCKWLFWHPVTGKDGRITGQPYRNVSSRFLRAVTAELKAAQERAEKEGHDEPDFRKFRFHDLRHDFAVAWLKAGRSIYDLKDHLGHESVKTTEIYLKFLTPEEKRAVMYGTSAPAQAAEQRGAS